MTKTTHEQPLEAHEAPATTIMGATILYVVGYASAGLHRINLRTQNGKATFVYATPSVGDALHRKCIELGGYLSKPVFDLGLDQGSLVVTFVQSAAQEVR